MAVELSTVLPALLNSQVPAASSTFAPGTAPVTIQNRFFKWRPRDFHVDAVPYASAPTATQMTNTANALNNMGAAGVVQEYEQGIYWIDRTISPNGADTANNPRQVYFNNTTLRIGGSVAASNFQECFGQGSAGQSLAGLNDASDNLPTGEVTRALYDVTNSDRSTYSGTVHFDANNVSQIACIAATNRHSQSGANGLGATWENVRCLNGRWGLFGTPRYGQARNFYAGAFVGNIFKRVRVEQTTFPILSGGNTIDDCFMGELNVINKSGGRSYLFAINLVCGTIYVSGANAADYWLDIQKASLTWGTHYAEGDFDAPIVQRANSYLNGILKYGGSPTSTVFTKGAFVWNDDTSGAGDFGVNPESYQTTGGVRACVALTGKSAGKRAYTVKSPGLDSDISPFKMIAGSGSYSGDFLVSHNQDGFRRWTVGGSGASPTLAATAIT